MGVSYPSTPNILFVFLKNQESTNHVLDVRNISRPFFACFVCLTKRLTLSLTKRFKKNILFLQFLSSVPLLTLLGVFLCSFDLFLGYFS